ncbi:2,3-bisphosphoglycerate-independent phosphoglycerate mutase [Halobacterium salinarum]|uniref:2,3-bisphosphoglycerate-independent phosphoglycerate mutase n=6 Tax=Halobacterium salinarum TaxID=2242 RepID=GPMI_HALSA|nr:2,3-bisphosphoglycerate-independent phosphoglycerate mutase [Halobacterium salinarum]Q9HNY7.1 RecName: Full=2,3-bisphosphoglycerate-independent phosphoglycerate mutase; Short=BPG-independent PGAM; Short=Phosphoglyceromutase; Short=iPGM [Halobacterium salinarum NRC-1]AAG20083.1 phosphoglycerate mutase [Halobacterium salinarum NRC-1]MBB6089094.1 2,3-bisphosphoglycerate-independent phosphoglycerate mutase [Halobacterium salinarum]MDL0119524.1 2,3-bisphosphoglycerate-independent phosphoglycerate
MQAALVILDGWGLGDHDRRDAVRAADTPTFDEYAERGAFGTLTTSGRDVGLPDGQMGNSEVGHLTIGAGRVVKQAYTRIEDAIAAGDLCGNDAISGALDHVADTGGTLHVMGLVSDGGVHADQQHIHALVECAAGRGVEAAVHAFTDGRDTSPTGGEDYLADLEAVADEHGTGDVASVSGRYYAMDRDQNWARTKRAYDAITRSDGVAHHAAAAVDAVTDSYERGDTDEFVEPTTIEGGAALSDGDAVVFANFRADRARQLTRLLADIHPADWDADGIETNPPAVPVVTMTEYDETFDCPVAFPAAEPTDTLGAVLAAHDHTQLRVAESEKYAHVTYFLNGGREVAFDGETRTIVDSPDVPTYDEQPAMSAPAVTDTVLDALAGDDPDVLVLNYANPDMVGHTGDFDAAIEAVEAVDRELGRLVPALNDAGAHAFLTADHGNADDLGTPADPHTAHTFNPVPFVSLPPASGDTAAVRDGGALRDIAPTLLDVLGIDRPTVMTGASLLE